MLCEICGKNPAKIHITQLKENKKYMLHICHECSQEYGIEGASINPSFSVEQFVSASKLSKTSEESATKVHQTCPSCGLSYGAFKESGRLGCALCYDTFSSELKPLLRKLQKDIKHVGKTPGKGDARLILRRSISELRLQLKEAVCQENFEMAARLRDQIRDMEGQLSQYEEQ
ncbi:MAG: UvrB/UvrC motif-containing protein [Candidatus Hinthialibacter sp.]